MMRMKMKNTWKPMMNGSTENGGSDAVEWEVRPGGMLVQKRDPGSDHSSATVPTIRVRVKYGSSLHEIHISSQATFGELKKMLAAETGLHQQDQKIVYKDKERNSSAYLDIAGVKDKSKMVLLEDPMSQEKRFLEMRRSANTEKASKSISEISLEVDRLASQVSALEAVISKGGKVAENDVLGLIELLMTQLIKLDGIMADGDAKLQRRMQVRRVQKYVETLDLLKIRSGHTVRNSTSNGQSIRPCMLSGQPPRRSSDPVVVTTKWETFDLAPAPSTSTTKMNWEFFECDGEEMDGDSNEVSDWVHGCFRFSAMISFSASTRSLFVPASSSPVCECRRKWSNSSSLQSGKKRWISKSQ